MTVLHAVEIPANHRSLESADGSRVAIEGEPGEERLRVRDRHGALIFDYDPDSGRATLSVPGDLSLATEGTLDLAAARGVCVTSPGPVAFHSSTVVSAGVSHEGRFSGMRAVPQMLGLSGRRLDVTADEARLAVTRSELLGERAHATVERVKVTATRIETVAERAIQRFKNVYEHVDELKQQRLGRLRALVRGAIDLRGASATVIAEREVKIDGERIHLG